MTWSTASLENPSPSEPSVAVAAPGTSPLAASSASCMSPYVSFNISLNWILLIAPSALLSDDLSASCTPSSSRRSASALSWPVLMRSSSPDCFSSSACFSSTSFSLRSDRVCARSLAFSSASLSAGFPPVPATRAVVACAAVCAAACAAASTCTRASTS